MAFEMQLVNSIFFGFHFTAITIFKDLFYNYIISNNMSRIKKSVYLPILFILVKLNFTIIEK